MTVAHLPLPSIHKGVRQLPPTLLKRKPDPRLVTVVVLFFVFWAGIHIFGLLVATPERNWVVWRGDAIALPLLALLIAPAVLSDKGYKVGWDDEGIYAQLPGWRFEALTSSRLSSGDRIARDYERRKGLAGWLERPPISFMRFGDIASVGDPSISAKGERPTIYISGRAQPAGIYNDLIGIDLDSFKRSSVLDLLEVIHSRRPDLVPQGWAKQLQKRRH